MGKGSSMFGFDRASKSSDSRNKQDTQQDTQQLPQNILSGLGAIFNRYQQPNQQNFQNQAESGGIGHFGYDQYGRGFNQGFDIFRGPQGFNTDLPLQPQQNRINNLRNFENQSTYDASNTGDYVFNPYGSGQNMYLGGSQGFYGNPYAAPLYQRYTRPFRATPETFVPKSAKDYISPFSGKEQTYKFDLTRGGTAPLLPDPVKSVTAPVESVVVPDPYYYYYDATGGEFATGGMTKAAAGRYLQGPGDGTSDSIPATIGNAQPARLADGEFVIDARTVSEIGNGSSNAGAKKLYAMMERVHRERKKAKRGQNSNADRFLPR